MYGEKYFSTWLWDKRVALLQQDVCNQPSSTCMRFGGGGRHLSFFYSGGCGWLFFFISSIYPAGRSGVIRRRLFWKGFVPISSTIVSAASYCVALLRNQSILNPQRISSNPAIPNHRPQPSNQTQPSHIYHILRSIVLYIRTYVSHGTGYLVYVMQSPKKNSTPNNTHATLSDSKWK